MADAAYAGTADRFAQYDIARQRAQQQGLAAKQQNNEAIKRRFASIGNLNSGAAIKAADQSDQAADAQTQANIQDVNSQEQQARNQLADIQQAQQFQAGESQKTRDLQSSQFDKTQAFQQQVFADESKFRGINAALQQQQFAEDQKANSLNAIQALGTLSDETLRQLGGASTDWGGTGNAKNIQAILSRYGYNK
jgi:hypothetical protein